MHACWKESGDTGIDYRYTPDFKRQKKIITSGSGTANCKVKIIRSQCGAKKPYCFVIIFGHFSAIVVLEIQSIRYQLLFEWAVDMVK